jgi:toxin ParE1/3/4
VGLKVRWSEPALDELDEALGDIASDNSDAAQKLWLKIRAATRSLREHPHKGRVVPEYADPTLRELIVGPFRIVYTTEEPSNLSILAVVRSERLLDPGIPERS